MQQFAVYLAPRGFERELAVELGDRVTEVRGRLVFAQGPPAPAAWAQNVWLNPDYIPIASIKDGVNKLKAIQRNWACHSVAHHRRAALIQEQLPKVSARPVEFGASTPTAPLGSWTLLEPGLILASPACSSPFPHGEVRFVEDKTNPPSRAYLKLWEAFTLAGKRPGPDELCLDLGSSPGGWSWVAATLGASVFSVDKADLAPNVAAMPNVEHCTGSGFGLDPRHCGEVDWLFSDMACYPDRLYQLVTRWMELGQCRNFVCTLKFQGETDHQTARSFAAIPDSHLVHLSCNKHELTWMKLS